MRAFTVLLSTVLAFGASGQPLFAQTAEAATETVEAAPTLPAITVSKVESRVLTDRVLATGLIAPVEEVRVAPLIEGQPIEALMVDISDMVKEGDVLAVLSKSTLELQKAQSVASLAAARATIAQAEAQLLEAESSSAEAARVAERTAKLRAQGSASQAASDTASANAVSATARVTVARQSLESARAQLALGEAQLENVDLMLGRTEVKAPYAGRIVERNATIGAIATASGQPMFIIEKDGALEVRAEISEADLLRVAEGQKALLRAAGLTEPLTGSVRLVEPAIDAATRLGRARIAMDAAGNLRAGVFIEAEIIVTEVETLSVPVTAVSTTGGTSTVMRVVDGTVQEVTVEAGIRDSGMVQIISGLDAGDLVVLKAASFVRNGDKINPIEQ